jgi:hypothetical protein
MREKTRKFGEEIEVKTSPEMVTLAHKFDGTTRLVRYSTKKEDM